MADVKTNVRKDVALGLFSLADTFAATAVIDYKVDKDPTNPYAFRVTSAGKTFRVIVKEIS